MIDYLAHARITGIAVDGAAPRTGHTASGYGSRIATRYRVAIDNSRTYRVYAMAYGNGESLYVTSKGTDLFLGTVSEALIEDCGAAGTGVYFRETLDRFRAQLERAMSPMPLGEH